MGMAGGGITPGGIVYMEVGRTVPGADPGEAIYSNMRTRLPETLKMIRGLTPNVVGASAASLQKLRPTREEYFNPQQEARRADYLAQFNAMGDTRRAEDIAAAERYLKEAESPIQAAQDEARKAAIASTLMRLGAGVAAGKPAEGLASATEAVEQTLGRAREVASSERRAARQDYRTSEREAIRGQRSVADQAFTMQAQNITNDENRQREFVNDQRQFAQWAFTQDRENNRDQQQAFNNSLQLSIGITQAVDTVVRETLRERNLNDRQYAATFGPIFKSVLEEIRNADHGNDEEGNPINPTPQQLIENARERTIEALDAAGIYSPSSVANVTTPNELKSLSKGQRYRGPDGVVRIKP
jgi:hypothetical protein